MQIPIGGLVPPEPPEKWRTIGAALDSDLKTKRLCKIILYSAIPVVLVAGLVLLAAAYARWLSVSTGPRGEAL